MNLERLKQILCYDPIQGKITNRKSGRLLVQDDYGFLIIYDNITKKKYKIKAIKIAWELGYNQVLPDNLKLLNRNLVDTDIRLNNLLVLNRKEYLKVTEAVRNMDRLKLIPHPDDQYSYVISYQLNGAEKREVIYDIVAAKQQLLKLQLKYTKIINKYCIFD